LGDSGLDGPERRLQRRDAATGSAGLLETRCEDLPPGAQLVDLVVQLLEQLGDAPLLLAESAGPVSRRRLLTAQPGEQPLSRRDQLQTAVRAPVSARRQSETALRAKLKPMIATVRLAQRVFPGVSGTFRVCGPVPCCPANIGAPNSTATVRERVVPPAASPWPMKRGAWLPTWELAP